MPNAPHYALFFSPHYVGSQNGYEYHKGYYQHYLNYLQKTPQERHLLSTDTQSPTWAISTDKGFIGPPEDTPGERRIVPKKMPQTTEELRHNQNWSKLHGLMEKFFGRMKKLWQIFAQVYRNDHSKFDIDFENCAMLTNEHIRDYQLDDDDLVFFRALHQAKRQDNERKSEKRHRQLGQFQERKRIRLESGPLD